MTSWFLYDDPGSRRLSPFTLLRPASALLLGAETIEERWRRLAPHDGLQVVCRPSLVPLAAGRTDFAAAAGLAPSPESSAPPPSAEHTAPVRSVDTASNTEIWMSDLLWADGESVDAVMGLAEDGVLRCGGALRAFRPGGAIRRILAAHARPGSGGDLGAALAEIEGKGFQTMEASLSCLDGLADLISFQERVLMGDLDRLLHDSAAPFQPGDGFAYHPGSVRMGEGCRIDHGAVLDARDGPIVLGPGCVVSPHTWVKGPFFAARGCELLGGRIGGGTSLGPRCRIRGEVEATVFLGWDNKAHDGFVGHSYIGEWVNLGALTTTSDLKNNYSSVTLEPEGRREATTLRKVGVFLGDHVKTRIGSLLTCGTIAGVGSNLIGEPAVAEKFVADFTWGTGAEAVEYDINKFLATAEIVYGRRGVPWTPAVEGALREAHAATGPLREAAGRRKGLKP